MFQRIQNCEYPFDYLLSINDGKCRYCDFNGGTMKTNPDVNRLQNHYMEEHPVTQHEGHWTQKMSDQDGEKTIAIFGLLFCARSVVISKSQYYSLCVTDFPYEITDTFLHGIFEFLSV